MSNRVLLLAVCSLGVSALLTQLVLMRELLCAFSGNELVLGIVLGSWLLLTGIGSAMGRTACRWRAPLRVLAIGLMLVAVLPIADVFVLRTLRDSVFLRGSEVGLTETVLSCLVLLSPYCLVTGYLLTLACMVLADRSDSSSIGRVYALDNIGDVLGGLLFSFVLILYCSHFGMLYVPAALNLLLAALLAWQSRHWLLTAAVGAVAAALLGLILNYDLDEESLRLQFAGQHVAYHGHSPYGSLVVTESAGQYNFIESGVPWFSSHNVEQVEETVHYAMAQRPHVRRVLLISGGVSGTAREILKYKGATVDYVELDPLVLLVAQRFLPQSLADPRIRTLSTDGRLWVRQTDQRYDVVIVDVPDPSTSQLNRFYTREFFAECRAAMAPGGVLSFSLGNYENYLSRELADLIAVAHRTLREVFSNVEMLPGNKVFFLASDGELTRDIAPALQSAGVTTRLVNRDWLRAMLSPDRTAEIGRAVRDDAPVNEDFNPILYFYHLRYWASQFKVRFGLLEAGLLVLLTVYLVTLRPVSLVIFTGGFAASALEVVLLIGLQVLFGCLYYQVGLIVTMFMLGLGIGSSVMNRMLGRCGRRELAWLAIAVAVFAVALPLALKALGQIGPAAAPLATQIGVPMLALLLAVLVGLEFPLAGKVDFAGVTSTAARLYTADYVGAALGALLVSTWLIPVMGVTAVCWLAAGLNVLSAGMMYLSGRQ